MRQIQNSPPEACILKQNVAAVTQQIIASSLLLAKSHRPAQLDFVAWFYKYVCRTTDTERTVVGQQLVSGTSNARRIQCGAQRFKHSAPPWENR